MKRTVSSICRSLYVCLFPGERQHNNVYAHTQTHLYQYYYTNVFFFCVCDI